MLGKALLFVCATLASINAACLDVGAAKDFNAVIFGNYQGSSDVQGKIAVGGDAVFSNGFSVGDQVTDVKNCNGVVTVVKGKLSWQQGRNYFGNIVAGSGSNISPTVLENGCKVQQDGMSMKMAFDFDSAKTTLSALSKNLHMMSSTVKAKSMDPSNNGDLTIRFSNKDDMEVIHLDANDLSTFVKRILEPQDVKPTALIIFHIMGTSASIANIDMEALSKYNVLFNFPEATSVTIQGVRIRGGVLAPLADIKNAQGAIDGPVYCNSLTGPIQINLKPLTCAGFKAPDAVMPASMDMSNMAPAATATHGCTKEQTTIKCRLRPATTTTTDDVLPTDVQATSCTKDQVLPTDTELPTSTTTEGVLPTDVQATTTTDSCTKDAVLPTETEAPTTIKCRTRTTTTTEDVLPTDVQATSCTKDKVLPTDTEAPASTTSEDVLPTDVQATTSTDSCTKDAVLPTETEAPTTIKCRTRTPTTTSEDVLPTDVQETTTTDSCTKDAVLPTETEVPTTIKCRTRTTTTTTEDVLPTDVQETTTTDSCTKDAVEPTATEAPTTIKCRTRKTTTTTEDVLPTDVQETSCTAEQVLPTDTEAPASTTTEDVLPTDVQETTTTDTCTKDQPQATNAY